MAESHGTREFIGSEELVPQPVPQPETAAQTHRRRLRQAYECWQCGDFAMVDSHGTREFIGGGELQTHGWRQPFETGV